MSAGANKVPKPVTARHIEPQNRNNFRSLVSIQGPEGYGPSTLPLRHSEVIPMIKLGKLLYSNKCQIKLGASKIKTETSKVANVVHDAGKAKCALYTLQC